MPGLQEYPCLPYPLGLGRPKYLNEHMTILILNQHGRASRSQSCPLIKNRRPAVADNTVCVSFVSRLLVSIGYAYPFCSSSSDNFVADSLDKINVVADSLDKINVVADSLDKINPESSHSDNENVVNPFRVNDIADAGYVVPESSDAAGYVVPESSVHGNGNLDSGINMQEAKEQIINLFWKNFYQKIDDSITFSSSKSSMVYHYNHAVIHELWKSKKSVILNQYRKDELAKDDLFKILIKLQNTIEELSMSFDTKSVFKSVPGLMKLLIFSDKITVFLVSDQFVPCTTDTKKAFLVELIREGLVVLRWY